MSTLRCLKMRLSVIRPSMSSQIDLREGLGPGVDVLDQLRRQVLVDAARTEVVGVQASAASALVEHHQLLAFLEAPERRRQGADVHGLGRHVQQVVQDPADFRVQNPDDLATDRHLDAEQLLDGQAEGVFLVHRRHVVEAVEVRNVLQIGPRFHQLLGAAMQQADVRIDAFDDFAIQLQHQTQHAVRGRVLRAEVDVELANRRLRNGRNHGFVSDRFSRRDGRRRSGHDYGPSLRCSMLSDTISPAISKTTPSKVMMVVATSQLWEIAA